MQHEAMSVHFCRIRILFVTLTQGAALSKRKLLFFIPLSLCIDTVAIAISTVGASLGLFGGLILDPAQQEASSFTLRDVGVY